MTSNSHQPAQIPLSSALRDLRSPDRRSGQAKRRIESNRNPKTRNTSGLEELLAPGAALKKLNKTRQALRELEMTHDRKQAEHFADAYGIGLLYEQGEEPWLEFCRDSNWENQRVKPKADEPDDALRFISHWLARPKSKATRKKSVYLYRCAFCQLAHQKVKANDAISVIRSTKGGLSGLAKAYRHRMKSLQSGGETNSHKVEAEETVLNASAKKRSVNASQKFGNNSNKVVGRETESEKTIFVDKSILKILDGYKSVKKTGRYCLYRLPDGKMIAVGLEVWETRRP